MPIVNGVKKVILYLEDWQKRMIKDFLGVECNTYEVDIEGHPVPIFKYGVPTGEQLKRMYFTDWQIREIKDGAGVSCEFIELHKDVMHLLYMPPHTEQQS
jgi:hypothetical protein